jgi:CIC family chloride channel protein
MLALISKDVLGMGYHIINSALLSELAITALIFLLVLKLLGTIISYGSGNAGDLIAPSLFLGAMTGGFMGHLAQTGFPTISAGPGPYALVGMGAAFAGIIRAPMTSVLLIFELTHDYTIIVPLMIANMISFRVSERFSKTPLYDALALQDGIHLPSQSEQDFFKELRVGEIMKIEVTTFLKNWPLLRVMKNKELKFSRYPVVDKRGNYIGLVSTNDIQKEYLKKRFHKKMYKITEVDTEFHTYPDQSAELALRKMGQKGIKTIPVVDRENTNNLLGIITASDIFRAYGIRETNF